MYTGYVPIVKMVRYGLSAAFHLFSLYIVMLNDLKIMLPKTLKYCNSFFLKTHSKITFGPHPVSERPNPLIHWTTLFTCTGPSNQVTMSPSSCLSPHATDVTFPSTAVTQLTRVSPTRYPLHVVSPPLRKANVPPTDSLRLPPIMNPMP
jgi:hypothetical protein